ELLGLEAIFLSMNFQHAAVEIFTVGYFNLHVRASQTAATLRSECTVILKYPAPRQKYHKPCGLHDIMPARTSPRARIYPLGLTYIGLVVPALDIVRVDRHVWAGDREANKQSSATAALQAVLDALKKELPPALPQ